jgi:predicted alpha/beta hydrolase
MPAPATCRQRDVAFRADCAKLQGRLFLPSTTPRAAIVLHGATGVPQRFYAAFAAWLAEQGYACFTYDYRDFGASATKHVRHSKATMAQWGVLDQAAAQETLEELVPDTPVWAIGHSLGGMMLPFQPNARRLARVITVAAGPAHLRDHPMPYRAVAAATWYLGGPIGIPILGYMPARRLGLGPDLPRGVFWQWRRWCTRNGFYMCDVGRDLPVPDWRAVQAPIKFVAVKDDALVPAKTVWRAMQHHTDAPKRQLVLKPENYGLKKIGHIRMFAQENKVLWPDIIAE